MDTVLLKIIHLSLVISLAALFSITWPAGLPADSLWKNSKKDTSRFLLVDSKAAHVGDIVVILISQSTKVDFETESENKKTSSVLSTISALLYPAADEPASGDTLNQNKKYTGSRAGMHNGVLPKSEWDASQNFKGEGTSTNQNTVTTKIAARVIAEFPNDTLLVEGKRQMKVNEEEETVVLSGVIRREDIKANNTIESQYLADANIRIEGKGPAAASQKKGLLTKMWEWLGLY
jgi:flagellar L-ring protein precursor FlgH